MAPRRRRLRRRHQQEQEHEPPLSATAAPVTTAAHLFSCSGVIPSTSINGSLRGHCRSRSSRRWLFCVQALFLLITPALLLHPLFVSVQAFVPYRRSAIVRRAPAPAPGAPSTCGGYSSPPFAPSRWHQTAEPWYAHGIGTGIVGIGRSSKIRRGEVRTSHSKKALRKSAHFKMNQSTATALSARAMTSSEGAQGDEGEAKALGDDDPQQQEKTSVVARIVARIFRPWVRTLAFMYKHRMAIAIVVLSVAVLTLSVRLLRLLYVGLRWCLIETYRHSVTPSHLFEETYGYIPRGANPDTWGKVRLIDSNTGRRW